MFSPGNGQHRPTVAVLLPQVWSVRNVVTSGLVARLLEGGCRVILLMRKTDGAADLLPRHAHLTVLPILTPALRRRVRGRAFLGGVLGAAFEYRNETRENKQKMRRIRGQKPAGGGVRGLVTLLLAQVVRFRPIREVLSDIRLRLWKAENDLGPILDQLNRDRPDLVYSTVSISFLEFPYVLAARALGIPVVSSVLSFDNLTSRAELPVFDHYFVWNERMRDDLLRIYPEVPRRAVSVTGTPQFDFHRRAEFCWTREQTLEKLGLPRDSRYILHAANSSHWTPTEPDLVAKIADQLTREPDLRHLWIVVRLHPLDTFARWNALRGSGRNVAISMPWFTPPDDDWWALLRPEDQQLLVSTIAHSALCANMASTMSLDAAILDRPVIGIAFSAIPGSAEEQVYRSAYNLRHYAPLVQSGAISLADSLEAYMALVRESLGHPEEGRRERAEMVARECGVVDGAAHQRVADSLLSMIRAPRSAGGA
jgi:hypothetical protein